MTAADRRALMAGLPDWRPLHPEAAGEAPSTPLQEFVRGEDLEDGGEYWESDVYTVTVRRYEVDPVFGSRGGLIQLGISSADGTARHDWRDMQGIKNRFAGPEAEGFELFPAESRLLDPSNYYTLWCFPSLRIKVGVNRREVLGSREAVAPQRGFGG